MKNTYLRLIGSASAFTIAAVVSMGTIPFTHAHDKSGISETGVSSQAAAGGVSDAQIAAIVVAADAIDIDYGKIAESKTTNPKVKAFAQQMIRDHTAVNKAAVALVTKLGVTPEESDTSRGLNTTAEETRTRLNGLSGKEFDKAYIDNEVAYHKLVLNAVDNTLIPSAQNAELKSTLVKTRPLFAAHLHHAEMVQSSLGRTTSGARKGRHTRRSSHSHRTKRGY